MTVQHEPFEITDSELDVSGGAGGTFKFFRPNEVTVDSFELAGKRDIGTGGRTVGETLLNGEFEVKYRKIEI